MKAYDLVLGLPWFNTRNPEIDWTKGRLTALRTPNGPQRAKIPEADHTSPLPERGEGTTNVDPPPDIQLLGATTFDHLLASEEVVEAFAIQLGECQGLLGASLEGISEGEGNPRMLNAWVGAAAVVAAEEWHCDGAWMTATGSPRHEGRNWLTGLGPIVTNRLIQLFRDPYPSPPAKHATMQYVDKANENRNRHRKCGDGNDRWRGSHPSTISRFRGGLQQGKGRDTPTA